MVAFALTISGVIAPGCTEKQRTKAATAPVKGVVGKVLHVRGTVTFSLASDGERKPLTPGMALRAEWTVHTGSESEVTARLSNGHRWTLSGNLSKRISKITALTLAPVKEGAVDHLADLGTRDGKDRSAAAGLHQERTAGTKAAPSRAPQPADKAALDEIAPPSSMRRVVSKQQRREQPRPRGHRKYRKSTGKRRPPMSGAQRALLGLGSGGGRTRTRGGGTSSRLVGGLNRNRAPVTPARPSPPVHRGPAPLDTESRPKRLTATQIDRVVRPLKSRLLGCLKAHKIKTTLSLRLVIRGTNGRVTAATVAGRSSGDAVVRCLLRKARSLRFAPFSAATQTTPPIGLKVP